MVSPTRRPLASLLSFALATSVLATTVPTQARARGQSVSLGSVGATSSLLVAHEQAPASVLGLDGEDVKAAQDLTAALRSAFSQRGLSGGEELSLVEMRLTMGCENLEPSCMAEGGKTLGVDRLVYGNLQPQGPGKFQLELEILDVQAGVIEMQTSEPITAEEMSPENIDAKALAIVNGLLGSEEDPEPVPSANTTLPTETNDDDSEETLPPDEPREKKYWFGREENTPTWKKAGLGVSATIAALGLVGVFVFAIPSYRSVERAKGWTHNLVVDAARESQETPQPVDPNQGTQRICDQALEKPNAGDPTAENPDAVYNAEVGKKCQIANGAATAGTASIIALAVGGVLTATFVTLMFVHKKKEPSDTALSRHQVRFGVSPTRGGAAIGSSFRF